MTALDTLINAFVPGERVFLPGSAGEILPLSDAMASLPPLAITSSFVPGINRLRLDQLSPGSSWTGLFAQPGPPGAQEAGLFRHLVQSYGAFAQTLAHGTPFDNCLVHVAPPDADGMCSLGAAVEFTPIVARRARRLLAVINPRMPRLTHAVALPLRDFALAVQIDAPLYEYDVGAESPQSSAIAALIADFVPDGACLQIGLGKVPDALLRALTNRRRLRLHSGMLSDGVRALVEAGSLDPDTRPVSCVHVGSQAHYRWLADRSDFAIRPCDETHAPATLSGLRRMVAVNGALSVDLFGQANLEMLGGRAVSGVGGAADFARAAALAGDGISIIALPATSGRSDLSRIVPQLDSVASLPRQDVDVVVTEHGAADLRGLTVAERGRALIRIAAPQHRATLDAAFHDLLRLL